MALSRQCLSVSVISFFLSVWLSAKPHFFYQLSALVNGPYTHLLGVHHHVPSSLLTPSASLCYTESTNQPHNTENAKGGETMVYFITYDLNKSDKDYEGVFQAIKDASNGVWCHYWDSSWLIKSYLESANEVFDLIRPHLDSNDRCFVIEVKENKQGWLLQEQWDYINQNIFG